MEHDDAPPANPIYTGDAITRALGTVVGDALWERLRAPQLYVPTPSLVDAVNVALTVRQPLLVSGEPGCGKTHLAHSIVAELAFRYPKWFSSELLVFNAKSTSVANELFYNFDAIGRFYATKEGVNQSVAPEHYIDLAALGLAIVRAAPLDTTPDALRARARAGSQQRSVVLIDEIDKAPRDFPNDILNEIEAMAFEIRELGGLKVSADFAWAPVVVITTNSDKNLPNAFLRRCVYYDIPFPKEQLNQIVTRRVKGIVARQDVLLAEALTLFLELRHERHRLDKKPGVAELLAWLEVIAQSALSGRASIVADPNLIRRNLSLLLKSSDDMAIGRQIVEDWLRTRGTS